MKTTRRLLLKRSGLLVGGVGLASLMSRCGPLDESELTSDGGSNVDAGAGDDAGFATDGGLGEWATGGTLAMLARASYPDPFTDTPDSCAQTCSMTLGPCYAASPERSDISEGYPGIPVRFSMRLLDESCQPLAATRVDLWHCALSGLYSGDDASNMCTAGDADARAHRFFRGTQYTDSAGKVFFDSCFPGWYSGRAVHVHYRVVRGTDEYLVSQFFFAQELVDDIFAKVEGYRQRGVPDTTLANDTIITPEAAPEYMMRIERMGDGAMLASKTVIVRSALSTALCAAPGGSGGPGGMGGMGGMGPPPGDGGFPRP